MGKEDDRRWGGGQGGRVGERRSGLKEGKVRRLGEGNGVRRNG